MEHPAIAAPAAHLEQLGIAVTRVPCDSLGLVSPEAVEQALRPDTRLVSIMHANNEVGTIQPLEEISELCRDRDILFHTDAAQSVGKIPTPVRDLGVDLLTVAGHKMYAPMGIGVLYGKREHLEAMPPYQGGGDMILSVTFEKTTYNQLPFKFEAGTPNVGGVIGLGAAVDFLGKWGLDAIAAHETDVLEYATKRLAAISGVKPMSWPTVDATSIWSTARSTMLPWAMPGPITMAQISCADLELKWCWQETCGPYRPASTSTPTASSRSR